MTTNHQTGRPSLPTEPEPLRPLARYWIALAVTAGITALVVSAAAFVEVDYFAYAPGSTFDTTELISVGGGQATFAPDGDIFFLTVGISRETLLAAARDWADRDVDIVAAQGHLQGRTEAENRAAQAALMTGSEQDAIVVALDRLGIPRTPTGTGVVIVAVVPDSPAVGVLDVADVIVSIDGQPVTTTDDLDPLVRDRPPGTVLDLQVEGYDGRSRQVDFTLGARPDDPTRGFLGIQPETRDFDPGSPFPISIDAGRVGGPSAGLAFSLAIIDLLTEGELTGGQQVAVTGQIARDGTVVRVGGVPQKSAAAAASGADYMIVPAGEEAEAQRLGYDLEVIGVATLQEALDALESIGGDPIPPLPSASPA